MSRVSRARGGGRGGGLCNLCLLGFFGLIYFPLVGSLLSVVWDCGRILKWFHFSVLEKEFSVVVRFRGPGSEV